jgi:PAS domain S-box-containing protein
MHNWVARHGLARIVASLTIIGVIVFELISVRNFVESEQIENTFSVNLPAYELQREVEAELLHTAINTAIDSVASADRENAIAEVVRRFGSYFSGTEAVLSRLQIFNKLTASAFLTNYDLTQLAENLLLLRTLVENSAEQDAHYFRRILTLSERISSELSLATSESLKTIESLKAIIPVTTEFATIGFDFETRVVMLSRGIEVLLLAMAGIFLALSWRLDTKARDLAQLNSTLDKAIETSLDAVIITDALGKIRTYNLAAEKMFDLSLAEVSGVLVEDLLTSGSVTLGKRRLNGRQIAISLARSANRGRVRLKLQKNDGKFFTVEAAVVSDVDNAGSEIFIAFLRDISNMITAERSELAARIEAERSSAANARFLAVMSHEMRTPLHGIISALDLLDGQKTSERSTELHQIARDCAGSALEQIEEVLELALFDVADVPDVLLTFFPLEVARLILEQSQPLAAANHTTLTLASDPLVSEPMLGNRRAFRSAISNLVGNAIKFTKNGEIIVQFYPTPNVIGSMRIEVRDTGIGIHAKNLNRIAVDFETVEASSGSAKQSGASGLGLGIVQRAVALMGGKLEFESTFGMGSRFWFDIPLTSSLLINEGTSEQHSDHASDLKLNLLVVDDIPINRLLLGQMLEKMGHTVETADDGAPAVKAAQENRFDLILMDINMPGMNGVDATRKIRESGLSVDVPIMGVTANAQPHELAAFKEAGMDLTLVKPITSAALALKVQELRRLQSKATSSYETRELTSLVASEIFDDLQRTMTAKALMKVTKQVLLDADVVLSLARNEPLNVDLADHIHKVAGPIAMIGAIRLHRHLCDLEDSLRANNSQLQTALLDKAMIAKNDTDVWFRTASY